MAHRRNAYVDHCSAYLKQVKSIKVSDLGLDDVVVAKLSAQDNNAWNLALLFTSELRTLGLKKSEIRQFDRALARAKIGRMPRRVLDTRWAVKHLQAA